MSKLQSEFIHKTLLPFRWLSTDRRSANEVHEATVGGKENCLATTGCLEQTEVHETL